MDLRPPHYFLLGATAGVRYNMVRDLCYRRTVVVVVDIYVISYECISVCRMSIAVVGNAFTIVASLFDQPIYLLFCRPF